MRVRSLALLSVAMSCGVGGRLQSEWTPAWESPYAAGSALKSKKAKPHSIQEQTNMEKKKNPRKAFFFFFFFFLAAPMAYGSSAGTPRKTFFWSSHCGAAETNPTSIDEDSSLIPGLAQWVRELVLP